MLSGVGNIYRAEVLFRHRVNPFTPGEQMELKTLKAIWKDLGPLLRAGMVDRRIVCTKRADPAEPEGAGAAWRGALCVPAACEAVLCVWGADSAAGRGGPYAVLVSAGPGDDGGREWPGVCAWDESAGGSGGGEAGRAGVLG